MVTIAGNGMGESDFSNLKLSIENYDVVICDKSFKVDAKNILKLPFKDTKEYILSNYKDKNILYVVTGSPLFFSAGVLIASKIPKEYIKIVDNTSCKDYILERLMLSQNSVESISLHGRSRIDLDRLFRLKYTLILADKDTINRLKEALKFLPKDSYKSIVGYRLGCSDELIAEFDLYSELPFDTTKPYVVLIERLFNIKPNSRDEDFITERGMITKRYKRDLSLQYLDLEPNLILWDIGAGSGSCAIEAYKRYKVKTTLFEKKPIRCEYIKQNLTNHKVIDTKLYEGEAQEIWQDLDEIPDRIFVGGGGKEVMNRLNQLYERLKENGIMLIAAVTLKNLSEAINCLNRAKIEHSVISMSFTEYKGKLDMSEPQRQIFWIKVIKG